MMRLIEFILKFEQRCLHLVNSVAFCRAAIDTKSKTITQGEFRPECFLVQVRFVDLIDVLENSLGLKGQVCLLLSRLQGRAWRTLRL
jgi:hypothetical protein